MGLTELEDTLFKALEDEKRSQIRNYQRFDTIQALEDVSSFFDLSYEEVDNSGWVGDSVWQLCGVIYKITCNDTQDVAHLSITYNRYREEYFAGSPWESDEGSFEIVRLKTKLIWENVYED